MRRSVFLLMTLAVTLCVSQRVQAQYSYPFDNICRGVATDFKRMNAYPEPFNYTDREATRTPFRIMVAKGWQLQNTLGAHYFNSDTQQLNRAGQLKVHWVVNEAPEQFRTVYVMRGEDTETTSIRVDAVQQAIARFVPNGALPAVVETGTELRGFPGEYVDDTYRKAFSSLPAPVLPAAQSATTQ